MKNIGAIYVWITIILLFTFISPNTFPTSDTASSIINQYAITGIVALALVVPLAAGLYDLSIGFTLAFAGVLAAKLLDSTGLPPGAVIACTILCCVVIGLLNSVIVVVLRVNSFIGTLGMGAILSAVTAAISDNQNITGGVGEAGFTKIASTEVIGTITLPVVYLLVIMVAIGYWLERTGQGRSIYAVGFDPESSRLSGLRVKRLSTLSLVTSATIAGFAGIVLAARISAGSPEVSGTYLIPAFSAAFLGATQIRSGRFNPWGTVIAVMLLGTCNIGLLVSGGPTWTPELFTGVVLISAVALAGVQSESISRAWRYLHRTGGRSSSTEPADPSTRPDPG